MRLAKSATTMASDTNRAIATAELTMQRIIDAITPVIGPDFFRSLARHLTDTRHVDFACVVMVGHDDFTRFQSIAASVQSGGIIAWLGGALIKWRNLSGETRVLPRLRQLLCLVRRSAASTMRSQNF